MFSNPELTYSIAPEGFVMMTLSPVCSTTEDRRWTKSWLRLLKVMSRITSTPLPANPDGVSQRPAFHANPHSKRHLGVLDIDLGFRNVLSAYGPCQRQLFRRIRRNGVGQAKSIDIRPLRNEVLPEVDPEDSLCRLVDVQAVAPPIGYDHTVREMPEYGLQKAGICLHLAGGVVALDTLTRAMMFLSTLLFSVNPTVSAFAVIRWPRLRSRRPVEPNFLSMTTLRPFGPNVIRRQHPRTHELVHALPHGLPTAGHLHRN